MTYISFLLQAVSIVLAAWLSIKLFKLKKSSFIYLTLTPFLVFYQGSIIDLFFILAMGTLLSLSFFKPSKKTFFLLAISVLIIFLKDKIIFEINNFPTAIHFINQQRGEHLNTLLAFLGRLFHNKSQLLFTLNESILSHLSPQALFAQAPYPIFSTYYPLGWLFPWCIYPLAVFIQSYPAKSKKHITSSSLLFIAFLSALVLSIGLVQSLTTKLIITLGLVYFLSILIAHGYQFFSHKKLKLFFSLNFLFLLLHFFISQSYIQPL